jgi:hypothetical protein
MKAAMLPLHTFIYFFDCFFPLFFPSSFIPAFSAAVRVKSSCTTHAAAVTNLHVELFITFRHFRIICLSLKECDL